MEILREATPGCFAEGGFFCLFQPPGDDAETAIFLSLIPGIPVLINQFQADD
jgi:hypothetical protein